MGGKSKSSSSSSVKNTYNTTDNRLAVESGGFGIGAHAEVEINVTDGGAIETFGEVAEGVTDALEKGFDALPGIVDEVTDFAGEVVEGNTAVLAEKLEDNSKEIAESTIRNFLLAGTAIAIGVAWMMKR